MRNTIEYPVLPDEVLDTLKRESDSILKEAAENLRCGDMRPMIYRYIATYLDLNKHDFERFLLSQPTNGPDTKIR